MGKLPTSGCPTGGHPLDRARFIRLQELTMTISAKAVARFALLPLLSIACAPTAGDATGTANQAATADATLRDVLLVGNSVGGTVSFLDGHTYQNLGSVNVVPDLSDRLAAIKGDLIHSIAYSIITDKEKIKHFEPANGQRFVDDTFLSPDGTILYVSRGNLGDVVAFDMTTASHPMLWRHDVSGYKSDHATLSPDGSRIVVSATAVDKAEVLDAASGKLVTTFATGHYPHQNDYSADGTRIYNGSIGDISLSSSLDFLKGFRLLTVVDASSYAVLRTYYFPEGVRPSVFAPDGKTMYAELSYLNGLVRFDLNSGNITSTLEEPLSDFAKANYPSRDDYPHDSAHHGLALSTDGSRLCEVGTIDNTVSIVSTDTMTVKSTVDVGLLPYWATTSVDGSVCFVTVGGANAIAVVDYATGQILTTTAVGNFPQRNRLGKVSDDVIALLAPNPG
jgi:DNA-binding beta-propeller fold protein YncE